MAKGPKKKNISTTKARRSGSLGFGAALGVIALLGIVAIAASRGGEAGADIGPDIGDHQHAAFGINICGTWQPNTPQYESPKGIHSHGDGFIHMHPYSQAGANDNATVGLYLEGAGQKATDTEIELSDAVQKANGDTCPELGDEPGEVRWSVNGEEMEGNPSRYVPEDGDIIAVAFLPEGEEIGVPPVAASGQSPSDINPTPSITLPDGVDPNEFPPAEGQTPDAGETPAGDETPDTEAPGTETSE